MNFLIIFLVGIAIYMLTRGNVEKYTPLPPIGPLYRDYYSYYPMYSHDYPLGIYIGKYPYYHNQINYIYGSSLLKLIYKPIMMTITST